MGLRVPNRRTCVCEYNAIRTPSSLYFLLNSASIGCHADRRKDRSDTINQLLFDVGFGILDLFGVNHRSKQKRDSVEYYSSLDDVVRIRIAKQFLQLRLVHHLLQQNLFALWRRDANTLVLGKHRAYKY